MTEVLPSQLGREAAHVVQPTPDEHTCEVSAHDRIDATLPSGLHVSSITPSHVRAGPPGVQPIAGTPPSSRGPGIPSRLPPPQPTVQAPTVTIATIKTKQRILAL